MVIHSAELAAGPVDVGRVGGKAAGLARLLREGVEVPPFFVLPPGADRADAVEAWRAAGWRRVAVRSSAVAEDGARYSFAGLFVSVLGVTDEAGLLDAVQTCRDSEAAPRVRAYLAEHGLPDTPVCVIVQDLVDGEASGVLFTTDPDDPDRALISAAWGLGEGVVSGAVPADTWRVDAGGTVEVAIAHKDAAVRLVDGHTAEVPVDPADRDRPCLDDRTVGRLARLGRTLEQALGQPLDVEFTVQGGRVVLLQAWPITRPVPRGRRMLWDNSNIIESYYGPVSPLTYTFARNAYTIVYQLFCEVMGVDRQTIRANAGVFHCLIGLVRGRIYYNLNAWYRVVSLLPGYRWNRGFLEQMMGVSEVASEEVAGQATSSGLDRALDLARLSWRGVALAWRVLRLDRDVARFHALFDATLAEHRARDLRTDDPHTLLDGYHALEQRLLWAWSTPIVNDFFVMVGFGLLRGLSARWLPGHPDLPNALVAGEGGLDSTAPTVEALRLAGHLRRQPDLLALFRSDAPADQILAAVAAHSQASVAFDRWIERWGDRCADELKLEVPTMRQEPAQLVALLRGWLRSAEIDPDAFGAEDHRMRTGAEAIVTRQLSGPRAWTFRAVLRFARKRVKDRENLRFLRTRVFGRVREIFSAMGEQMAATGALGDPRDVFWLTLDEVMGWVRATTVTTDLRALVDLRRREYDRHAREAPPADRFTTWGPVWAHNRFAGRPAAPVDGALTGLGACPGRVEGRVRRVTDPRMEAPLDGEILVAYRTDPGWVPLFPSARAILVERGSLLSHSAVVAREMGIPTVVGIAGLTARLKTGDRVRVDGGAGTVELLDQELPAGGVAP